MEKLLYGKANLGADEGHNLDDHANYIGGWGLNNGIKSKHYVPLDPEILMGVVEWRKATEVHGNRANLESERAARAKDRLTEALLRNRGAANPRDAE